MRVKKWVRNQQVGVSTTVYVDGVFEHHRQYDNTGPIRENNTLHVMTTRAASPWCESGILSIQGMPHRRCNITPATTSAAAMSYWVVMTRKLTISSTREEYFPYGETSFGSFGRKRYRYSGKERDEESGCVTTGRGNLSPSLGRWVSCDPVPLSGRISTKSPIAIQY